MQSRFKRLIAIEHRNLRSTIPLGKKSNASSVREGFFFKKQNVSYVGGEVGGGLLVSQRVNALDT